ncbi:NADP-dependent oxidoreductase domain-containing protein [Hysterangium stoloniferum]|nr:NADP-dependent oxidoreductase domain-containing protein [Hysterangium stoloniferum]
MSVTMHRLPGNSGKPVATKQVVLGVSAVDLYLIHNPRLANGDITGLWKKLEDIHARGLAKHIGVSNFNVADLKVLLKDAKIKPAVNQIIVHPYVYAQQKPTIEFCKKQSIAIEAYSPLIPVTQQPGGPVDTPLAAIAKRTGATFDQILLAWNKTKGTIVLTWYHVAFEFVDDVSE